MEWNRLFLFLVLFAGLGNAWYGAYNHKIAFNCSSAANYPIVLNGSSCFYIGSDKQCIWANCTGNAVYVYYDSSKDYVVTNTTDSLKSYEVEVGNISSSNPTSLWTTWTQVHHLTGLVDSTLNYNLTNSGGVFEGGFINNAGGFDANADYMQPAALNIDAWTELTACMWIKLNSTGADRYAWSYNEDASYGRPAIFYDDSIGKIVVEIGNGATQKVASASMTAGTWLWICGEAKEGDYVYLFINGTQTKGEAITVFGNPGTAATIGNEGISKGTAFRGLIDEFRFVNRMVSSAEINASFYNMIGTINYGLGGEPEHPIFSKTETYNSSGIEGSLQTFGLVVNSTQGAVTGNFSFNGTVYDVTPSIDSTIYTFSKQITLPNIVSDTTVPFFWSFSINGTGYNAVSRNFAIQNLLMFNCSGTSSNIVLRLFMVNETAVASPVYNATVFINLNASTINSSSLVYINFTANAQHNITICANNTNFGYVGDVDFIATGYVQRTYHVYNGYYNGSTTNQTLYFLSNSQATLTKFRVVTETQTPLSGAYLYLLKEFPTSDPTIGLYYAVSSARMDDKGEGYMYLQLDKFYKYNVVYLDTLQKMKTDDRMLIQSNLDTIQVETTGEGLGSYWLTAIVSSANCTTTYATNTTICRWVSGGDFARACFYEYYYNGSGVRVLDDYSCYTDLQGTVSKVWTNAGSWSFEFVLFDSEGNAIITRLGSWTPIPEPTYDYTLALLVVIVILTFGVVLGVPEYTVLLGGVVFAGAVMLGILPLGVDIGILGLFLGVVTSYLIFEGGKNAT